MKLAKIIRGKNGQDKTRAEELKEVERRLNQVEQKITMPLEEAQVRTE